ncbi:MAG: TonB-dependent receptor [Parafilimonas sp.]|nr:TonB-dependent receptor [Parafilimonas sp.]
MKKVYPLILLLVTSLNVFAQNAVQGTVTDVQTGKPVVGASIIIKGEKRGVVSDNNGKFTLNVSSSSKTIVVSSIGYATQEVTATGEALNIQLTQTSAALNEVVVVGYGTSTKRKLTGNIAKIKGEDIENIPVPNFTQALQGRAAGVFVESQSGKVGEGMKIRIRGAGSINASNDPLYVIDGIPINSDNSYSGNPLADINFNDIESFDILKDAAAKAIYGSRGSNGVIIITTKKGKAGRTNINADLQYGINRPTHLRGFLNANQYVDLLIEAAHNRDDIDGYAYDDPDSWTRYAKYKMDGYSGYSDWRKNETNTDWQKQAFNYQANTYSANISASGGTDKTKFYTSLGYDNEDGIEIGNNFRRISGRLNLDQTVSDKFKLGVNLSLSQTFAARVPGDQEFTSPLQMVAFSPITPVRNKQGKLYNEPVTTYPNPLVDYENSHYNSVSYRSIGSVYGQYNFVPSFFFRSEFGYDILNQNDDSYYGPESYYGAGIGGLGESDWFKSLVYNTNNYFTFKKIYDKHDFEATAGMSYQDYTDDYANVKGQDFPAPQLEKLGSAGTIIGGTSASNEKTVLSYFGRVSYAFDEKYLLYLSGRFDGSSVFGAHNKYGFFPAVSAGWILSQEDFLKNSKTINFLKLRASYGLTGNDDIPYYSSLGLWQGASYGGVSGLTPYQLANPNLEWEKEHEFDVGVEFGFFKNSLNGELDYYDRKTTGLLYNVPPPGSSGFGQFPPLINIGSMDNRGVEIVLNSDNIVSKNLKWSTSFNLSYNRNRILKLDGKTTIIPSDNPRYLNSLVVGQSIGVYYGPKYAGVDPQNGDALYYTQDGKTTNQYNDAGNFIVGDPNPDWIGGITNDITYKGFELNFLFQGVFGNQVENGGAVFMTNGFQTWDNQTSDQLNRWQKPGDITNTPQLRLRLDNGEDASSRFIYDASYIRLKNIMLAYNLPASILSRIKFQSLKLYVSAVNLLTFTKYPGWDPEVNTDGRDQNNRNQGSDFYSPPQIKNISFGLSLGF